MEKQNPYQTYIIDCNDDVGYFDRDMAQTNIPTSKEIPLEEYNDQKLIEDIDFEIQHSRQNFFKIEVVKGKKRDLVTKASKRQNQSKQRTESRPIKSSKSIKEERPGKRKCKIQNHVVMQGYLEKKYDSNIFFKWNARYTVLTSQKLYLFEDSSKKSVLGCFNFKILPAQTVKCEEDNGIRVSFDNECQDLILRTPTALMKSKWLKALESVIERNSQEKKLFMMTSLKPLYQQSDTITEDQFLSIAQTGDILLFLTDHTAGKLQRFLTQSNYDHVAMVIRLNGQLMVFQANQGDGVAVYKWRNFVKYFNLYQKVVYRRLKCWRKKELHSTFLSFARKNIGKKFEIGTYKLLLKQESDFDWAQERQRGYFCSELIAKALKIGGLLDPVKASSRYWPIDFSADGNLLLIGASLSDQQSIVLNKFVKNI